MPRPEPEMGSETDVFFERVIAIIIDSIIVAVVAGFFNATIIAVSNQLIGVGSLVSTVIVFAYFIYFEGDSGQTIGKRAMGIVVVKEDGEPCDYQASAIRNILRVVDILPFFYILGVIVMVLTDRSQRVGDVGANTIVTRVRKSE